MRLFHFAVHMGLSFVLAGGLSLALSAQPQAPEPQALRRAAAAEQDSAVQMFRDYLALPNDGHFADDIEALLAWLTPELEARGFTTRRLAKPDNPLLFAERQTPGAERTVLIYLQADGQPVDPSAWQQENPYEAVLKRRTADGSWQALDWPARASDLDADWRIFARSASDSKGPNIQFLKALDVLDRAGAAPAFNLKVVVDTEEELKSPSLAATVAANREALAADMLWIFDGPPHASGAPTLAFGARGIATLTLTAHGPTAPQHSGHYGNWLPNPALLLAQLLASMKDSTGRVTIAGYYDGISIPPEVRRELANVPDDLERINAEKGVGRPDRVASTLQEALQYPSLNIRGLRAGWVGEQVRTIIPATAVAEIDLRLVRESDPVRLIGLIREHIERRGFTVLDHPPSAEERARYDRIIELDQSVDYTAFRTDFDSLPGVVATRALTRLNGAVPIRIRTMGGSVPISPFVDTLAIPAVLVPTVNPDNNQHSPNENIRIGDFLEGIVSLAAVLAEPPGVPAPGQAAE